MFEQISGEDRVSVLPSQTTGNTSATATNEASSSVPFLTLLLIGINALVFAAMLIAGVSPLDPTPWQVIPWGANAGPFTMDGQEWRLFTACFVHFGFIHLGMNMYVLFQVGLITETLFGRVRFLLLYLLAGLGGSLLSLYVHPLTVSAGASGAIFGLYGALLGFLLVERKAFPAKTTKQTALRALFFLGFNLIYGLANGKVDLSAHLGGFLTGFLAGCALARPHVSGRRRLPLGRTIATGVIGSAVLVTGFVLLPKINGEQAAWYRRIMTGSEVAAGNKGHVVYSGMASAADAEKLAQGLQQQLGLFKVAGYVAFLTRDSSGASIYLPLGKDESSYQPVHGKTSKLVNGQTVIYPYEDPAPTFPWNNAKLIAELRVKGISIAPLVGGVPIRILILNNKGELRKTIEIDQHELDVGLDKIWFSGTATRGDAKYLGDALQECGFFHNRGALVALSKTVAGKDLSFVIADGTWDKPGVLSGLQAITRKVAGSVGGLPITVNLIDITLQPRKTFIVQ